MATSNDNIAGNRRRSVRRALGEPGSEQMSTSAEEIEPRKKPPVASLAPPSKPSAPNEKLAKLKRDMEARDKKPEQVAKEVGAIEQNFFTFDGVENKIAIKVLQEDWTKGPEGEKKSDWLIPLKRVSRNEALGVVLPMFVKGVHSTTTNKEGLEKFSVFFVLPKTELKNSYNVREWFDSFDPDERKAIIREMPLNMLAVDDNGNTINNQLDQESKDYLIDSLRQRKINFSPAKQEILWRIILGSFKGQKIQMIIQEREREKQRTLSEDPERLWLSRDRDSLYVPKVYDDERIFLEEYEPSIHGDGFSEGELQFVEEGDLISIQIPQIGWSVKKKKAPDRMDMKIDFASYVTHALKTHFKHLLSNRDEILGGLPKKTNDKQMFNKMQINQEVYDFLYEKSKDLKWVQFSKEFLFRKGMPPTAKNWIKEEEYQKYILGDKREPVMEEHLMSRSARGFIKRMLGKVKTNKPEERSLVSHLIDNLEVFPIMDPMTMERYVISLNKALSQIRVVKPVGHNKKPKEKVLTDQQKQIAMGIAKKIQSGFTHYNEQDKNDIVSNSSDKDSIPVSEKDVIESRSEFDNYLDSKTREHNDYQDDQRYESIYEQYDEYGFVDGNIDECWGEFLDLSDSEDIQQTQLDFMNLVEKIENEINDKTIALAVEDGKLTIEQANFITDMKLKEKGIVVKRHEEEGRSKLDKKQEANREAAARTARRNAIAKSVQKNPGLATRQDILDLTDSEGVTREWLLKTKDLQKLNAVQVAITGKPMSSKARLTEWTEWLQLLFGDVL